ncbi:MAG TPA: tetratricopeptide repeat protein [Candidatus Bathyarchaeia archaeon]|nr:tetratricopeptide repeat protein [Candidatus Bathyarchaeia archaeon]
MTEQEALTTLRGDDVAAAAHAAALLWQMWHESGDARIDRLLLDGIEAMERQDLEGADAIFTRLISVAPAFAEGWNKRATVRYMAASYADSIADCRETLARNPHHFGALSGQGLCHLMLGQYREAADLFRRTLAVHPHLTSARSNLRAALNEIAKLN